MLSIPLIIAGAKAFVSSVKQAFTHNAARKVSALASDAASQATQAIKQATTETLGSTYLKTKGAQRYRVSTTGLSLMEKNKIGKIARYTAEQALKYIIRYYGKRGPHKLVDTGRLRRTIRGGKVVVINNYKRVIQSEVRFNHSSYGYGKRMNTKRLIPILEDKGDPVTQVDEKLIKQWYNAGFRLYAKELQAEVLKRL